MDRPRRVQLVKIKQLLQEIGKRAVNDDNMLRGAELVRQLERVKEQLRSVPPLV